MSKPEDKKLKQLISFIFAILVVASISLIVIYAMENLNIVGLNKEATEFIDNIEKNILEASFENVSEDFTSENEIIESDLIEGLEYKGYKVVGKIEMPSVSLKYPILDIMTNANALDVSVCIQYGVPLNSVGNTVIIGHNYKNGLFFGSNKKMKKGDLIHITNYETGTRKTYSIYKIYETEEEDTSYYNRDTAGKSEISLVTCQNNNNYRLVVLAQEIN